MKKTNNFTDEAYLIMETDNTPRFIAYSKDEAALWREAGHKVFKVPVSCEDIDIQAHDNATSLNFEIVGGYNYKCEVNRKPNPFGLEEGETIISVGNQEVEASKVRFSDDFKTAFYDEVANCIDDCRALSTNLEDY